MVDGPVTDLGTTRVRVADVLPDLTSDPGFDRIVRLAAKLFSAPVARISLIDEDRIWFTARFGFDGVSGPRENSFCEQVVQECSTLVVPDTLDDARYSGHPSVTGEPGFRFFAGAPLVTPEGVVVGAICVIDREPRPPFSPGERTMLEDVAVLVQDRLEVRRELARSQVATRRADLIKRLLTVTAEAPDFPGALEAAARTLCEATAGRLCSVWQLDPRHVQASLMAVAGTGPFASEEYFAGARALTLTPENSPVCRSLVSQTQVRVHLLDAAADETQVAAYALAVAHGIVAQITTPMNLLGEKFAFAVGFGSVESASGVTAQLLLDATAALLPLLRRHKDEEATRLFHRAVEGSSDPVVISEAGTDRSPETRITYVNPAFERETGYSADEVVGRSPTILHGPGTSVAVMDRLRDAHQECKPLREEVLQYHKDGRAVAVELNVSPVRDLAGQCTHFVAVHRDMSERNRVERIRMENSLELQTLMSAMPGALIRLLPAPDGRWEVIYIAPSIEALTGYTPAELKPGSLKARIAVTDLPMLGERLGAAYETGYATAEIGFRHRDGRNLVFQCQMRGNARNDGTREVIMSWTDITREREMALQLTQAAKLAQLGELTTGIAHELNQPLAGISLAAENALRILAPHAEALPRVKLKLDLVVALAMRASSVIDHMQVFGRTGSGPSQPVMIGDVLAGAARLLRVKLERSGVRLLPTVPRDLPTVLGKVVPLEQVLINLISNACDAYTENAAVPAGLRNIEVAAGVEGGKVWVTVRDQAGGIPPEVLPRIFEPFFTTKRAGKGTGLGLSISYGIVTEMAGELTVASSGGGTTFTLRMPMIDAPAATPGECMDTASWPQPLVKSEHGSGPRRGRLARGPTAQA